MNNYYEFTVIPGSIKECGGTFYVPSGIYTIRWRWREGFLPEVEFTPIGEHGPN